jgi:putative peptidoglycan lipid II flippase
VVQALQIYVLGMLFAAVDYPLNFAFYARSNTWLPALVGVVSVGVYALVALAMVGPLGYLGLVWADTAKQTGHALIMAGLLVWQVGSLRGYLGRGLAVIAAAALGMALVAGLAALGIRRGVTPGLGRDLALLLGAGGGGLLAYGLILRQARLPEAEAVGLLLRRRLAPWLRAR